LKSSWLVFVFLCVGIAQSQSLRVTQMTVHSTDQFPKEVQFYCANGYSQDSCREDVLKLRHELARYPTELLGQWSFVLVPSDNWKELTRGLGGAPVSPAFSVLENRTTVFEQAAFSPSPVRAAELLKEYGVMGNPLLHMAIGHELGHALCNEKDEHRADQYARELFKGQVPQCKARRSKRTEK
jgi:hypothetical protein